VLAQLADREEALRELQAQFVPQDVDLLKLQLAEELEAPHREKLASLEGDARKWEALFVAGRRTAERERTEHALFQEQVKAAIESDRAVFEAEVASLRRECGCLRSAAAELSLDEEAQRLRESLAASQHAHAARQDEASRLRGALEQLESVRRGEGKRAVEALAACEAKLSHGALNLRQALQQRAHADAAAQRARAEACGLREALGEQQKLAEHAKSEALEKQRELAEVCSSGATKSACPFFWFNFDVNIVQFLSFVLFSCCCCSCSWYVMFNV
jgi:coiled-coil domain-containing protein 41